MALRVAFLYADTRFGPCSDVRHASLGLPDLTRGLESHQIRCFSLVAVTKKEKYAPDVRIAARAIVGVTTVGCTSRMLPLTYEYDFVPIVSPVSPFGA